MADYKLTYFNTRGKGNQKPFLIRKDEVHPILVIDILKF